jgi:hypothetical protein
MEAPLLLLVGGLGRSVNNRDHAIGARQALTGRYQ